MFALRDIAIFTVETGLSELSFAALRSEHRVTRAREPFLDRDRNRVKMSRVAVLSKIALTIFGIGWMAAPVSGHAQTIAPSQVTPQSLRPNSGPRDSGIALSEQPALVPPSGSE